MGSAAVRRPCAEVPAKYRCRMAVAASHLSHRSRQEGARQTTRSTGHIKSSIIHLHFSFLPSSQMADDGSPDTAHGKLRKARRHESTLFSSYLELRSTGATRQDGGLGLVSNHREQVQGRRRKKERKKAMPTIRIFAVSIFILSPALPSRNSVSVARFISCSILLGFPLHQ